jgi:polyadenylate-binding protein 2
MAEEAEQLSADNLGSAMEDSKEDLPDISTEEASEADKKSIFIGNVHFNTSIDELKELFGECGEIERATIAEDKFGQAKGYAFMEFKEVESVSNAIGMDGTVFKKRKIKVIPKRTNLPGKARRRRSRFMQ